MASWNFLTPRKEGSIFGTSIKESLNDSRHTGEALLAREALQNSCDALNDPSGKVKIIIKEITLTGTHKLNFIKELQVSSIAERRNYINELKAPNSLDDQNDEGELKLLFIEDFNTHGLYGSFNDGHYSDSNLFKLLIQLGDNEKASQQAFQSGGSYGLGKAALSANSRLSTIAAYSNYNDKFLHEDIKKREGYYYEDGINRAFMACGYHEKHRYKDNLYTGVAIFGDTTNNAEVPDPLLNEDAEKIADNLFFTKRKENDVGTSILIIDTDLDIFKLRRAIEDYWWPKINDHEVEIELYKGRNNELSPIDPPRPKLRESLKPFIRAYEIINKIQKTSESDIKVFQALKSESLTIEKPATLGLQQIQEDDIESFVNDESEEVIADFNDSGSLEKSKLRKVALMRHPKMIIDYLAIGSQVMNVYGVGVFVTNPKSKHMDTILKMSEPQSHEKWEPKAKRLKRLEFDGKLFPDGEKFVSSINTNISRNFRGYLSSLKKADTKEVDTEFKKLSRLLGQYLKPLSESGPGGESESRPISIQYYKDPTIDISNGKNVLSAIVDLSISKNYEDEELHFYLKPKLKILGHNDKNTQDSVDIDSISLDSNTTGIDFEYDENQKQAYLALLQSSGKARVHIKSNPYDALWTISFEPIITILEKT